MIVCWSMKGGSGTTVVAAALAVLLSRTEPVLLVDLAGDAPAALGLPEPSGPGALDWLASPTADAAALHRLAVEANHRLQLLPDGDLDAPVSGRRWTELAEALASCGRRVVVDAGLGTPPEGLMVPGTSSLLVTHSCYLSMRRVVLAEHRPTGVVLVQQLGRALAASDIERAVGAPVLAQVPYDPAIARAVDSGMLASRLPRSLTQPLRRAA
jgi:hypothetical protein